MTISRMNPAARLLPAASLRILAAGLLAFSLAALAAERAVEPVLAPPTLKLAPDPADPLPPPPPLTTRARLREKTAHEQKTELLGITIGLVSVVLGIGIAFFAIGCDYRKRQHLMNLCHQERLAALEKGLELPPFPRELMCGTDPGEPGGPNTGLKAGLVWLAIGIGIGWFLSSGRRGGLHPSIAAIPIGIGTAYLIYYAIEGRKLLAGRPSQGDE